MEYKPSKFQVKIFDAIKTGKGNIIIQAVAGSGKTTTIIQATNMIPKADKSIFLAFNKSIADELRAKLPNNIQAKTLHSLGLSMFRKNIGEFPKIDSDKLRNLIKQELENNNIEYTQADDILQGLLKLIPMLKATLIDYTNIAEIEELKFKYNIDVDVDDLAMPIIKNVMENSRKIFSVIDFDDMIYLPVANKWDADTYDWVFVDETQDLNKSQFELIKKICNGKTRIIAVGDRQQSIYAFRGADSNSMDNFKEYFKAKELPLSICYRCAKKIVELAQEIVSEIEYSDTAKEGIVEDIDILKFIKDVDDKDLVLCRTNAPLIKIAFALIREGKKAIIRGKDIGRNLIKLIDRYKVSNLEDLIEKIINLRDLDEQKLLMIKIGKYDRKKKNMLLSSVDTCETLLVIAEDESIDTIRELKVRIDTIFSDAKEGIICSSVHKAKGLESDRVYITHYELMPFPKAETDEEIRQEMNIKYVAITRAKNELYFIRE